jgi:nucleoside phosphorylase
MARPLRPEDYTVGWVCALPLELAAAQEMLDEEHHDLERDPANNDNTLYILGSIGVHNVAIVCLPAGRIGNNPAAAVSTRMRTTFSSIRFGLMVGIGGGVPSEEADVRLGDVVVSNPYRTHGGVVQYDSGKSTETGFERTGSLNPPPSVLLNAVAKLRAKHMMGRGRLAEYLSKLDTLPDFTRGAAGTDILFEAEYDHRGGPTCRQCDTSYLVDREPRRQELIVHYGTIASGNQVMRSATERDRVSAELGGVLCFEMEAAGLMNSFPCLVIRGICDYADSHKNKRWQLYAAATAAAYAKELLLSVIPPAKVANTPTYTVANTHIYTVGWVCAVPVEFAAAQEMLDEEHETPQYSAFDDNFYICGRVGEHNVVIACLPAGHIGANSTAVVAVQMMSTFLSIRFGLMVGIGGGVPSEEADVRLGDVVVSNPYRTHGGVVQYDSGKSTAFGFERTGSLNSPPDILLSAVAIVQAKKLRGKSELLEHVSKVERIAKFQRLRAGPDVLFNAAYNHVGGQTCDKCSVDKHEAREPRNSEKEVVVHYGTIASGNQVMRSATERDRVSAELGGVLCFEMEAAGLMNNFPCLVIRGICDYADSHKNKRWQPYAAATAAAYAKELLLVIPPAKIVKMHAIEKLI